MKISIIGAGNVGATLAMRVVENNLGDCVLVDIADGIPQGKAVDISDAAPIVGHENKIIGATGYDAIRDSDIIVITAGFARKPGMTRDDLINKNASIMKACGESIKKISPGSIVIVVTNPLDVMSYYVYKITGFPKAKVIGMAGTLDAARFKNIISEKLGVSRRAIDTLVLGCHGDTMVPILSRTKVNGKLLKDIADKKTIDELIEKTRKRGAEVVSFLKTGSAYYSPSAGALEILRAVKNNTNELLCVSAFLEGEYGISGCFLGVPAKINKNGISGIEELSFEKEELEALKASAKKTKKALEALK